MTDAVVILIVCALTICFSLCLAGTFYVQSEGDFTALVNEASSGNFSFDVVLKIDINASELE